VITSIGRVTVVDSAVHTHAFRFLPNPGAAPSVVQSKDAVEVSKEEWLVIAESSIVESVGVRDLNVSDAVCEVN
jgi:hypothetical protein